MFCLCHSIVAHGSGSPFAAVALVLTSFPLSYTVVSHSRKDRYDTQDALLYLYPVRVEVIVIKCSIRFQLNGVRMRYEGIVVGVRNVFTKRTDTYVVDHACTYSGFRRVLWIFFFSVVCTVVVIGSRL